MPKRKPVAHIASLILQDGNKFLLLRKPLKRGGKYSLIGGRIEYREAVITALVRETLEEAAIKVLPENLCLVHVIHRRREGQDFFHFFFQTTVWTGTVRNREPAKCDYLKWYAAHELPFEHIMPAIKCGLKGYLSKERYSELGWQRK